MYSLSNFIPFNSTVHTTNGTKIILAWNRKEGYHFTRMDKAMACPDTKIVAIEEE